MLKKPDIQRTPQELADILAARRGTILANGACQTCSGYGSVIDPKPHVEDGHPAHRMTVLCPDCAGSGKQF